uniref:Uncharacterized protein n=1 Tax=Arundo donax TaxID=35708 RepID=A0A0A9HPU4_ARUDO
MKKMQSPDFRRLTRHTKVRLVGWST